MPYRVYILDQTSILDLIRKCISCLMKFFKGNGFLEIPNFANFVIMLHIILCICTNARE